MENALYYVCSAIFGAITIAILKHSFFPTPFYQKIAKFKTSKSLPFLGHILEFGADTVRNLIVMDKVFRESGSSTFRLSIGPFINAIMLTDPETIETILGNNKEIVKSNDYDGFKDWLGDGLLMSNGNKWRRQRKIITPTFHFKILENFVSVFNDTGNVLIEKMKKTNGEIYNVYNLITLYTLDVICETAMGVKINAQEKSESEYVKALYSELEIFNVRMVSLWRRIRPIYMLSNDFRKHKKNIEILHGMTKSVIKTRKLLLKDEIERAANNNEIDNEELIGRRKKIAFLDLLLLSKMQDGSPIPDESIREEVDTFLFEGHDTTSTAISFALFELANNPDVQQRAYEEQEAIFGKDLETNPTYTDLQGMKYLECVIKETMRKFPPVPFYARQIQEDLTLPDGNIVPGGCQLAVCTFLVGRNPKYFPNPEKFDPERFSPDNTVKRHPYLFTAFSAGPRNCIGQKFAMLEMKSVLSKVLRHIELLPGKPESDLKLAAEAILKSKSGIHIRMKERRH